MNYLSELFFTISQSAKSAVAEIYSFSSLVKGESDEK